MTPIVSVYGDSLLCVLKNPGKFNSPDYLNVMARRGVIPAFKIRRNWIVSKPEFLKYLNEKKVILL